MYNFALSTNLGPWVKKKFNRPKPDSQALISVGPLNACLYSFFAYLGFVPWRGVVWSVAMMTIHRSTRGPTAVQRPSARPPPRPSCTQTLSPSAPR